MNQDEFKQRWVSVKDELPYIFSTKDDNRSDVILLHKPDGSLCFGYLIYYNHDFNNPPHWYIELNAQGKPYEK